MTGMIEMCIMGLNDRNLSWNKLSFSAEVRQSKSHFNSSLAASQFVHIYEAVKG